MVAIGPSSTLGKYTVGVSHAILTINVWCRLHGVTDEVYPEGTHFRVSSFHRMALNDDPTRVVDPLV
jgi:hypothetical protein